MYEVDQYTVSLLHFDDGLKDECGKVWTPQGGAVVTTDQKMIGTSSLWLDKTKNSYMTTPDNADFDFASSDFTVDFNVMFNSLPSSVAVFISKRIHYSYSHSFTMGYSSSHIQCAFNDNDITHSIDWIPEMHKWYHIAMVRSQNKMLYFINGILVKSFDFNVRIKSTPGVDLALGTSRSSGIYDNGYLLDGYLDEFRISNIARWTEDFTIPTAPSVNAPTSLMAAAGDSQVTLSWNAVTGATGYNVKRSTTAGGSYTTIATNVAGTSYVDNAVTNGTTYYYVVTAVNVSGNESANSNEASATPQAPSGHGLLRITMNDSSEREYRLSTVEIEKFIKWYDRTVCTGNTCYAFDDIVDDSKEYLSFERIISFKVIPLAK